MAEQKYLPLDLQTDWFRAHPNQKIQIPELVRREGQHVSCQGEVGATDPNTNPPTKHYVVFFACRWIDDLSRNFVKLHWTDNPNTPPAALQKYFPGPAGPISAQDLDKMAEDFGKQILDWC